MGNHSKQDKTTSLPNETLIDLNYRQYSPVERLRYLLLQYFYNEGELAKLKRKERLLIKLLKCEMPDAFEDKETSRALHTIYLYIKQYIKQPAINILRALYLQYYPPEKQLEILSKRGRRHDVYAQRVMKNPSMGAAALVKKYSPKLKLGLDRRNERIKYQKAKDHLKKSTNPLS